MDPLEPFGENIWLVSGPVVTSATFRYPTRMAVIRLSGGRLFIWSPTALSAELRVAVDALGEVGFIVAPNSLHHLSVPAWRDAYPGAALYAAPGLRARRTDIAFGHELGEDTPADWAGEIDQAVMGGNLITTEIVFFHRASGTALFTDLIQSFPPGWFSGVQALIARLDGMVGPELQVLRKFRAAFTDRRAARAGLRVISEWPVENVVMAHGQPVRLDARCFLSRAFRWLG